MLAVQLCSSIAWYRNLIFTSSDALHGLDFGSDGTCRFRCFNVPYVSLSNSSMSIPELTNSAKLLARLIAADPSLKGYTDLGKKAFGPWAGGVITLL